MSGNGIICKPIDPCKEGTNKCDKNARCKVNKKVKKKNGSYTYSCKCKIGFEGMTHQLCKLYMTHFKVMELNVSH